MVRWKRSPSGPGKVIDRRGGTAGKIGAVGLGGGGLIALIVVLFNLFAGGGDLGGMIDALPQTQVSPREAPLDPANDPDADQRRFIEDVLQDSQGMWQSIFAQSDLDYRPTDLVLFSGFTSSGCGGAPSQAGPHYCPLDERVYMDLEFFEKLRNQFGAAGDTAQAYVVAHEVGHHVQHLLGILDEVNQARQSGDPNANELNIDLELQADCFAGVWLSTLRAGGSSAAILEEGDLEEALNAAASVGDDHIQETTTGQVNPETWTHGSSAQRLEWLRTGFNTGQPASCDTFG